MMRMNEEYVSRLHRESLVVDTHCDTIMYLLPTRERGTKTRKLNERSDTGHIDLPRLIEGGVDCQCFAIYTARQENQPDALQRALQMIDAFDRECQTTPDIVMVHNCEEILNANKEGKVGALLSLEGSEPLMSDPKLLRIFYKLGVRMVSLTWNWRTSFADGISAKRSQSKLTELGIEAIEEMDRLGIVYDVSHLSDSCFWDVVDVKKTPFVASHSNCRAICDHPRNLTDDMIKAIADHDGVIGVNFAPNFVSIEQADVKRLIDHIDHIVKIAGVDYVGLGSDFDGISSTPIGLEDVSKMPNITRELVERGYCEEDIRKILGENHLRVFRKILR